MVSPRLRSRSLRRVKRRTPGGSVTTRYVKRAAKVGHCAATGERLKGVSTQGPKSGKRPSRPFGGMLSSRAMRAFYKYAVRSE